MNKQQLVSALSEKSEITKKASEQYITDIFDIIMETVAQGDDISLVGFGKFSKQATKGKEGVSKLQGVEKAWKTEDSYRVAFSAGKLFKDKVKA